MKKTILKTAAILLILAGMVSCGKEDNAKPEERPFTEYSLVGTSCRWANFGYDGKVIVINSNDELGKYITCTDGTFPEIDFTEKTLLTSYGGTTRNVIEIIPSFYQNSVNKYALNVKVLLGFATVAEGWQTQIVVPKMPNNAQIDLNVQIVEPF